MSDADLISSIQDYKTANNASLFKSSSPAVQASTMRRATDEKAALLALNGQPALPAPSLMATAGNSPLAIPSMPSLPAPVVVAAAPQTDSGPVRLNSAPVAAVPAPAPAPPAQDVRDRTIAHIVSGGIGGGPIYR